MVFIVHILPVKLTLKWQVTEARQLSPRRLWHIRGRGSGGGAGRAGEAKRLSQSAAAARAGAAAGCGAYSNVARCFCDSRGPSLRMVIRGGKAGVWLRRRG